MTICDKASQEGYLIDLTYSFLLYMLVFAALAGGKVPLYRSLKAPAVGKVAPAGDKVAPAGGKVAPAGGKVAPAGDKVLYRPLEEISVTLFCLSRTRKTTKCL
jgi:hypothetical protein